MGLSGTGSKDIVVKDAFVPEYRTHTYLDAFHLRSPGKSVVEIDAAHERMLQNFSEMMRLARSAAEIPLAFRARCRWDAGKATDWAVHAIDRLMMASGGRGIFLNNPIQRAWRDVHAMQAHAGSNLERAAAVFGRSEFGLPPIDIRF
jgi:3-hydroxy-9,10-secoandrosta-1,3,5(10)-triene-9,17-dione monooxygenase